ncbi:hypothetical protein Airi01_000700 [Actinoallomurus iriomotensis]|uniref:Uncharacterized protein n=1 Tax=Actinoallomurus iriomotensis TaxID=478107 RepID=A0A9W6RA63_9ACTN|nr:hypothetical protein Airi01_000700 [Actinoallomurus iriomotensis]
MQAADGDDRAGRGPGGEGRVPVVALTQPVQEGHDVVLPDLPDRRTAASDERVDVAPQVTPVGTEGVGCQAAVDREMIEVRADLGPQRSSELFSGG